VDWGFGVCGSPGALVAAAATIANAIMQLRCVFTLTP